LLETWLAMFGPPVRLVTAGLTRARGEFATHPRLNSEPAVVLEGNPTRYETSLNWSGAYAVPSDGKMFVHVSGRWVVPRPSLPLPIDQVPPGPGGVCYACTTWVGLDGQRQYVDSSLPQVGTRSVLQVMPDGSETCSAIAWCQWWVAGDPNSQPQDISVPIEPDDVVSCLLRVTDETHVIVSITNLSTNIGTNVCMTLPEAGTRIAGATAEWIMERPMIVHQQPKLYPFPNYTSTELISCQAQAAIGPGSPESEETLERANFIRMFEVRANPERTAYISMSKKRSDFAVRVFHGDFPD
jgi:hypothetical protein